MKSRYFGETTNIFKRASDHFEGLIKGDKDSVLSNHVQLFHANQSMTTIDFTMEVVSQQALPIQRQAEEGVAIIAEIAERDNLAKAGVRERGELRRIEIMNSRREFQQPLGGLKCKTSYL